MRFDSETRAKIHKAAPNPVTIIWPKGERPPQTGRVYWLQSIEDIEEAERKEKARREYSPETHAEVIAGMHRRRYRSEPPNPPKPPRHRRTAPRPKAGDPRILVIASDVVGKTSFEAKVVIYEDPDPVLHLRTKGSVGACEPRFADERPGPSTAIELEPEQIQSHRSRRQREEEEDALRVEHALSVDLAKAMKVEQSLADRRKRGRPAPLQEQAIARAKRRAESLSA
jgi:hypothetical protein